MGLGPQDRRKWPSSKGLEVGVGRRCLVRGDESSVIGVTDGRRGKQKQWGKHGRLARLDFIAFEVRRLRKFLSMRMIKSYVLGMETSVVWRVNWERERVAVGWT